MLRRFKFGAVFAGIAFLASAVIVASPQVQPFQDADVILFTLASTQKWTPFYWEQDRLGLLLPLLAKPIANPLHNLLFQEWLSLSMTFMSAWLLARCFLNARTSALAALSSMALMVLLLPTRLFFTAAVAHPEYGVALALGLAGVKLTHGKGLSKKSLALFALLLACWVNLTIPLILIPILFSLFVWLPAGERSKTWKESFCALASATGILAIAFIVNMLFVLHLELPATSTTLMPADALLDSWAGLWNSVWQHSALRKLLSASGATAIAAFIVSALTGNATRVRQAALLLTLLLVTAAIYALTVGLSAHVFFSNHFRYLTPSLMVVIGGAMSTAFHLMGNSRAMERCRWGVAIPAAVLLVSSFHRYGIPSLADSEKVLDASLGRSARAIVDKGCTHIMGGYWRVWPRVFWSNHLLHGRGSERRLYGITYRCGPTHSLWRSSDELLIAGIEPVSEAFTDWGSPPPLPPLEPGEILLEPNIRLYTPAASSR